MTNHFKIKREITTILRIYSWIFSQSQTEEWYYNPGYEVIKQKKKRFHLHSHFHFKRQTSCQAIRFHNKLAVI